MGYEVLSDDLYDDGSFSGSSKPKPKKNRRRVVDADDFEINTKKSWSFFPDDSSFFQKLKYVHIGLVFLLLLFVIIYLFWSFSFGSNDENFQVQGELDGFSMNYSGDLDFELGNFILETNSIIIEESSNDLFLKNFTGQVYIFKNKSKEYLVFEGTSKTLDFGDKKISLTDEYFKLKISKVSVKMKFDNFGGNFSSGNLIFDEKLNYEFDDLTVNFNDFKGNLGYEDEVFTFVGKVDSFSSENKEGIQINFN